MNINNNIYMYIHVYKDKKYKNLHCSPFHRPLAAKSECFQKVCGFRSDGLQKLICFKLLLRPWDLSHRVERQKLMVTSWREMFVRVRKGGFMANLL